MSNPIRKLADWLSLEDYERASRNTSLIPTARFARGNVAMQSLGLEDNEEYSQLRKNHARARRRIFG